MSQDKETVNNSERTVLCDRPRHYDLFFITALFAALSSCNLVELIHSSLQMYTDTNNSHLSLAVYIVTNCN